MTSANLNRYIKEYLKRQPKILSMSQIEELVEYDAWLDTQSGLTQHAPDGLTPEQAEQVRQMIQNALDTGSA